MKFAMRLIRYVALKRYETWRAWVYFKEGAIALLQYWGFHFRMRASRAWPLRLLAGLLSKRVPESSGFGKFCARKEGLHLPKEHPIFNPKNDRLFSKKAALKAFEHIKMAEIDDKSPAYAAERTEAEELTRVQAQLADAIKAMQADDARRVTRLKTVAGVVVGGLIVLAVLLFMK